jgi:hypothetical protein
VKSRHQERKTVDRTRYALFLTITAVLAAWIGIAVYAALRPAGKAAEPSAVGQPGAAAPASDALRADPATREEIRRFIESYFAVWSRGDMAAYAAKFDPAAQIALVEGGKVLQMVARDPFVVNQTEATARTRMTERMTSFAVDADKDAAQVVAQWELKRGEEKEVGVDRFTLMRDPQGQWRIVFLLFYGRKP